MEIAPGVDHTAWAGLNLNDPQSPDWPLAVQIFEKRIRSRFLNAVDALEQRESYESQCRFGFTILAIDCLLIETLYQFREGLPHTKKKSSKAFKDFLTTTPQFNKHFDNKLAEQFYDEFRCGILHQAEVKMLSRVKTGPNYPLVSRENKTGKMIVNRSLFHKALLDFFDSYIAQLRDGGVANEHHRQMFRMKMDIVCRVDRTPIIEV